MRRVYERRLTTSLGGNISMRLGSVMLITPSSLDKASLGDEDIAKVDIESGKNLTPCLKLSIESEMHRLIYLKRPTCKAVIHAHPVFSSLFSASEEEIRTDIIAERQDPCRQEETPSQVTGCLRDTAEIHRTYHSECGSCLTRLSPCAAHLSGQEEPPAGQAESLLSLHPPRLYHTSHPTEGPLPSRP